MSIKLRYVHQDVDRYGNVRTYFWRKGGPKIRLRETPGSEEFGRRYQELLQNVKREPIAEAGSKPVLGTYRWLCLEYFKSVRFRHLDKTTQTARRRVLESTFDEPIRPGATETFALLPLTRISTKSLRVLRDRKADVPAAANHRVKALRVVFRWALEEVHIIGNPARDLTRLPLPGTGFHSWTVEEVERFEQRHPVGTKARLAMALLLWTGVRRSDVVMLGRQHARGGWLKFTQSKNRNRNPVTAEVPVIPQLQRILDASPTGDMTYLVTEQGKPYTVWGFGNWFRDRCKEAGVPGRAHGLRKAGAATAAENGATTQQLMAIFGWLTLKEAERYTRAAPRKRMAGDATAKLVRGNGAQKFPTREPPIDE